MGLKELLEAKENILLYGITPPHRQNPPEKVREIAEKTLTRLESLDIDGLVLYDINDESGRNPENRPFPYLPTLDPVDFYEEYLAGFQRPVVIYRCVGKYPEADLAAWLRKADREKVLTVFVGAASKSDPVTMSLPRAYEVRREAGSDIPLGGVLIAERHSKCSCEHLRIEEKRAQGCSFFISQIFYNVNYTKSLISDYVYHCKEFNLPILPIILTTSICGSPKTLEFMKWLGINIPRWLENEILHAADPLTESYGQCLSNAKEVADFCRRLGVPFGFNVESVSNRLVEIEASVELAKEIRKILKQV